MKYRFNNRGNPLPALILMALISVPAVDARDKRKPVEPAVASSAEEICPLLVSSTIPDITLSRVDGTEFNLKQQVTKKPAVLIFYRGGW